ncbi:hypothetical protein [Nocardia aurea]|uniref:Uncharacterized protein n=1 Tax=Nocardia aurea TaxID=2144174 RepID=A0ABV3G0C4_9NOCA
MEFTHTGWYAVFSGTDNLMSRFREVEGWDPATGTAVVVDAHLGGRRLVTDYPDFSHLEKADRVITALPGDGWRACDWGRGPRNPDSPVEPVLAWLVLSSGTVVPITMDADGYLGPDKTMNRFFPPGAEVDH